MNDSKKKMKQKFILEKNEMHLLNIIIMKSFI